MEKKKVNKLMVLLFLLLISFIFLSMIRHFLLVILLAGIFAGLATPVYKKFYKLYKGKKTLASLTTLILFLLIVLIPLLTLLGIVTNQAFQVAQSVTPYVKKQLSEPAAFSNALKSLPFYEQIEPYKEVIYKEAGKIVERGSKFLINSVSTVTMETVNAVFMIFVFLYTMFFFLMDGNKILKKILYYLPLESKDEKKMLDKFTSVARATLKGVAIIGVIQGALAGAAFAVVGIKSAVFWGTIMTVLSIIPAVGAGIVWVPASIILAAGGHYGKALGLFLFCALIVGFIDNFLRPRMVGKDTQMHDLFIFFSTFGGLAMFGILGFIVGPIIAALFITIWEIYGEVFKDILPKIKAKSDSVNNG